MLPIEVIKSYIIPTDATFLLARKYLDIEFQIAVSELLTLTETSETTTLALVLETKKFITKLVCLNVTSSFENDPEGLNTTQILERLLEFSESLQLDFDTYGNQFLITLFQNSCANQDALIAELLLKSSNSISTSKFTSMHNSVFVLATDFNISKITLLDILMLDLAKKDYSATEWFYSAISWLIHSSVAERTFKTLEIIDLFFNYTESKNIFSVLDYLRFKNQIIKLIYSFVTLPEFEHYSKDYQAIGIRYLSCDFQAISISQIRDAYLDTELLFYGFNNDLDQDKKSFGAYSQYLKAHIAVLSTKNYNLILELASNIFQDLYTTNKEFILNELLSYIKLTYMSKKTKSDTGPSVSVASACTQIFLHICNEQLPLRLSMLMTIQSYHRARTTHQPSRRNDVIDSELQRLFQSLAEYLEGYKLAAESTLVDLELLSLYLSKSIPKPSSLSIKF